MTAAENCPLAFAAKAAADYRRWSAHASTTPVLPYADMIARLAAPTPEAPGDPQAVIAELIERATPGIRAQTGPRFFGWVIGSSHPTGVAADWLASAWGQNAANHSAAPAASAIEAVVSDWLLDLLDLPRESSIGIVTGATMASFVALAAARGEVLRRVGWDVEADGLFGAPAIDVLIGADAHATVFSALRYLGLGARRVHSIACDGEGAMLAADFERVLAGCCGPVIAIAQAGQITTGAFDPVAAIAPMVAARGGWLHVDGAFGLWARACPSRSQLGAGLELADSWATDGHKWLQTPYDCGFAIVRDADAHRRAMAISASYLPPTEGAERDPSATVPELSRRARGFSVWAVIKALGRSGIAEMVERHCALARRMAAALAAEPGIAIVNKVVLNQVIVRFGDSDDLTLATIARVQADAVCFVGAALWHGRWVMRISISGGDTGVADADTSTAAIIAAWRAVR